MSVNDIAPAAFAARDARANMLRHWLWLITAAADAAVIAAMVGLVSLAYHLPSMAISAPTRRRSNSP